MGNTKSIDSLKVNESNDFNSKYNASCYLSTTLSMLNPMKSKYNANRKKL